MGGKAHRIGLTMRVTQATGYHEPRDSLAQDWPGFLETAVGPNAWMFIPNLGAARTVEYCTAFGVTALILSGGDDLGVAPLRDETEFGLLDWAESLGLPALGICRGMQVMAARGHVGLVPASGHVATRHMVTGEITREVNSYHAQSPARCPDGFTPLARAEDGTLEAFAHETLPWEGWMWHPEREPSPQTADITRLKDLLEQS